MRSFFTAQIKQATSYSNGLYYISACSSIQLKNITSQILVDRIVELGSYLQSSTRQYTITLKLCSKQLSTYRKSVLQGLKQHSTVRSSLQIECQIASNDVCLAGVASTAVQKQYAVRLLRFPASSQPVQRPQASRAVLRFQSGSSSFAQYRIKYLRNPVAPMQCSSALRVLEKASCLKASTRSRVVVKLKESTQNPSSSTLRQPIKDLVGAIVIFLSQKMPKIVLRQRKCSSSESLQMTISSTNARAQLLYRRSSQSMKRQTYIGELR